MNDMTSGLLKFCLEHSDYNENADAPGIPPRDPNDYKWLREALDNFKTDAQKMKKILELLEEGKLGETEAVSVLEEIQYYVEDIDNSNDFWKIGGEGLVKQLENKGSQVKVMVMWIFATILQNNPESQAKGLKAGVLEVMISTAKQSIAGGEVDFKVLAKTISAISAMVKGSSEALERFISLDGVSLVEDIIRDSGNNNQIQVKTTFLLKYLLQFKPDVTKDKLRSSNSALLQNIIQLGRLKGDSNLDLREKVWMCLNEFLTSDSSKQEESVKSDIALCENLGLDILVRQQITDIKQLSTNDEHLQRHSDEVALCEELNAKLQQLKTN